MQSARRVVIAESSKVSTSPNSRTDLHRVQLPSQTSTHPPLLLCVAQWVAVRYLNHTDLILERPSLLSIPVLPFSQSVVDSSVGSAAAGVGCGRAFLPSVHVTAPIIGIVCPTADAAVGVRLFVLPPSTTPGSSVDGVERKAIRESKAATFTVAVNPDSKNDKALAGVVDVKVRREGVHVHCLCLSVWGCGMV